MLARGKQDFALGECLCAAFMWVSEWGAGVVRQSEWWVNGDSCVIGVMVDGNVCVQCMMGDVVHGWCAVWWVATGFMTDKEIMKIGSDAWSVFMDYETNCKCIICKNQMLNACSVLFSRNGVYTVIHTHMLLLNVIISVLTLWFICVLSFQNSL